MSYKLKSFSPYFFFWFWIFTYINFVLYCPNLLFPHFNLLEILSKELISYFKIVYKTFLSWLWRLLLSYTVFIIYIKHAYIHVILYIYFIVRDLLLDISNFVCSLNILKEENFLEKLFKVKFKLFCLWGTNCSGHYNMGW